MTDSTAARVDAVTAVLAAEGFDRGLLAGYRRALERRGRWHVLTDAGRFRAYLDGLARLEHRESA